MSARPARTDAVSEIRSALIPVDGLQILLPNTAIAEVIGFTDPEIVEDSPDWVLGLLFWRHQSIPVVSMPSALGLPTGQTGKRARVAVLNTLGGDPDLPFIGMRVSSTPRLVRATDEQLHHRPAGPADPDLVLANVTIGDEQAIIPDLDALEARLRDCLKL